MIIFTIIIHLPNESDIAHSSDERKIFIQIKATHISEQFTKRYFNDPTINIEFFVNVSISTMNRLYAQYIWWIWWQIQGSNDKTTT